MSERDYWSSRIRIGLVIVFALYLWRFFDPIAYSPLSGPEMVTAGKWFVPLALAFLFSEGREAFGISLFIVAPLKLLDDIMYFWFVLIPVLRAYGNWQFVLYDLGWSLSFYVLLLVVWFTLRGRALALLGLVAGFWLFPVAMITQGVSFFFLARCPTCFPPPPPPPLGLGGLVAWGFLLGFFLSRLLWPRRTTEPRHRGPTLGPEFHPRFHHLLQDVCRAAGQEVPDRIYLSAIPNICVDVDEERLGLGGERVLEIGAPLLVMLSQSNLRSVLAHEIGHFSGRHFQVKGAIYRTLLALDHFPSEWLPRHATRAEVVAAVWRFWLFGPLLLPLALLLRRHMRPVRRHFEIEADREAARLTGKDKTIEALRELAAAELCYLDLNGDAAPAASLWHAGEFERLYEYWRSTKGQADKAGALRDLESQATRGGEDYPSLRDRLRALGNFKNTKPQLPEMTTGDQPAHLLVADSPSSLQSRFLEAREPWSPASPAFLWTMQSARGLAALPGDERRAGESKTGSPSQGGLKRLFEAYRRRPLRRRLADICVAVAVSSAVVLVEGRIVSNFKAQELVLNAEREFKAGKASREEVIKASREALRMNPRYARAYNDLGAAYREENPKEAIANCKQAIALNPHYPLAYLNLGSAYFYKAAAEPPTSREWEQDHKDAIDAFTNAARLDRRWGDPWHSLGVVYSAKYKATQDKIDLDDAIKYFCQAARKGPNPAGSKAGSLEDWKRDCNDAQELGLAGQE